ncbi:MAG: hypothetical protein JOY99_00360 [Sphingomonadaceae bacterium]|nr:hypothetical protein [Sphingomonadaceae bacterium]
MPLMVEQTRAEFLDKLLRRREEIIRELAALDNLLSVYGGLSDARDSESSADSDQLSLYQWPQSRASQAAEIARSIEAARKIILREKRPMKRGELVIELERRGYILPGKDKNKVFGTNLWRSGKFRSVEDRGYWPKDVPLPRSD